MIGTAADRDHDRYAALGNQPREGAVLDAQAAPSMRVVAAIAEAREEDPAEMEPIYGAVDPDALDRLLDTCADVRLQFEYGEHLVEVFGDGRVLVDGEHFGAW